MAWRAIERPGHFGRKRDELYKTYTTQYGEGNWRLMWQWDQELIPYSLACQMYEDGYYADSFKREKLWEELTSRAEEVYDHQESDIESGLDYLVQKGNATHLQDIAIRRVVVRRGWKFKGNTLIQIRGHKEYWGQNLSPGKVPFHLPELIALPHFEGWWDYNSIEDFWQSNKLLQVKE